MYLWLYEISRFLFISKKLRLKILQTSITKENVMRGFTQVSVCFFAQNLSSVNVIVIALLFFTSCSKQCISTFYKDV